MNSYMTKVGKSGIGKDVTFNIVMAVKYLHDIFRYAAHHGMDVWMLCGSLRKSLRDDYFSQITGMSFADSVRQVLKAGKDVSIFLWNDPSDERVISPLMRQLIKEAEKESPSFGRLDIRASGTKEDADRISHFIVARDKEGKHWITRIEQPHRPLSDAELLRDVDTKVPAVVFFNTTEARVNGEELLDAFRKLSDSVRLNREPVRSPARAAVGTCSWND